MPRFLKITLLVSAATLLLCFLAIYNGFPLLYPDTGTYIRSGFTGQLPIDRPIFYGMFLRHSSLAKSPWLVILTQTAMLAWLLLLTLRRFVKESRLHFYYICAVGVLVFATGISYFTNLLIPDVFTPILFLAAFNLAFFEEFKWPARIALVLILMLALSTHLSHFPTLLITLLLGIVLGWLRRKQHPIPFQRKGLLIVGGAIVVTALLVPSTNAFKDGHFRFTPGGSIFMTNRLRDLDLVKDFLDAECATTNWKLCPYKEDLYGDFLWDESQSALYKTGGWEANFDEFKRMNSQILLRPKFLARFARASFEEGIRQFFVFQAGPIRPYPEESAPVDNIKTYFHSSLRACLASKQIHGQLSMDGANARQEFLVLGSLGLLLLLAMDRKRFLALPADLRWFLLTLTLFCLANAVICASLSNIDPRYQGRVAWLFPFALMLVVATLSERYDWPGRIRKFVIKS